MGIDFELDKAQAQLRDMVRMFAKSQIRAQALKADRNHDHDRKFLKMINSMGLGGGAVPKELGGEGDGIGATAKKGERQANRMAVVGAEELAWGDPSLMLVMPGPGLGGPPLRSSGTPEQQAKYFGIFKDKNDIHWGAYGLTEPGAGSDVAGISTTCRKDGDYYVLNGTKCFITCGGRADWVIVFATIDKSQGRAGHRAFIVEKGTPGFSVLKIEKKLGLRASETAMLGFEECRIHKDNLLGGEERYEKLAKGGFQTAMKTFDTTRPLVAAMANGIAQSALDTTRDFLVKNYELGRPVPRYAAIKEKLARMDRLVQASRYLTYHAVWMADLDLANTKEASACKAYSAKVGKEVTRDCLDLIRGHGCEEELLVEKAFRDIQVYDIFEGTGQVQKLIISRRLMPDIRID